MNILAFAISAILSFRIATAAPVISIASVSNILGAKVLAEKSFSLQKRYTDKFVNDVFKDNILLTLAYMDGKVTKAADINWETIEKPQEFKFTLKPGEVFTFHQDVLSSYQGKTVKSTNAHFNAQDGFKFSGLYYGDGVCHLASLIYWVAKDAGLGAERPASHDFMPIAEVPKEYGVSIYYMPGNPEANAHQNLYVTNDKDKDIRFVFNYDGDNLKVQITE